MQLLWQKVLSNPKVLWNNTQLYDNFFAFIFQLTNWETVFCYQKSSDLLWFFYANSRPSATNFKSFSGSLEQLFLTVGQNNFGNKIPFLTEKKLFWTNRIFFYLLNFHQQIMVISSQNNVQKYRKKRPEQVFKIIIQIK